MSDMPYNIMLEDAGSGVTDANTNNNCLVDNVIVASTHGPVEYNIGAH